MGTFGSGTIVISSARHNAAMNTGGVLVHVVLGDFTDSGIIGKAAVAVPYPIAAVISPSIVGHGGITHQWLLIPSINPARGLEVSSPIISPNIHVAGVNQ